MRSMVEEGRCKAAPSNPKQTSLATTAGAIPRVSCCAAGPLHQPSAGPLPRFAGEESAAAFFPSQTS